MIPYGFDASTLVAPALHWKASAYCPKPRESLRGDRRGIQFGAVVKHYAILVVHFLGLRLRRRRSLVLPHCDLPARIIGKRFLQSAIDGA